MYLVDIFAIVFCNKLFVSVNCVYSDNILRGQVCVWIVNKTDLSLTRTGRGSFCYAMKMIVFLTLDNNFHALNYYETLYLL